MTRRGCLQMTRGGECLSVIRRGAPRNDGGRVPFSDEEGLSMIRRGMPRDDEKGRASPGREENRFAMT